MVPFCSGATCVANAAHAHSVSRPRALGREHRVVLEDELLHMNPGTWEEGVQDVKARGLVHFRELGEVLFLHAETLFESSRCELARTVSGSRYDVDCLEGELASAPPGSHRAIVTSAG